MKRGLKPGEEQFGTRLKVAMANAGLNHADFAKRLGVRRNTVGNWVSGRCPPVYRVRQIADVLGVSSAWLLATEPLKLEDGHGEAEA
jgi:transcriptional regulator with XRE-family HTH domain